MAAVVHVSQWDGVDKGSDILQKLEEKAQKAQEAFEKEEKLRKELEVLNAKLLEEKNALLNNLEGEKGSLSETQERANKLQAQKSDLETQLRVCINIKTKQFYKIQLLAIK
jgi:myosin heavy chain 6/7